MGTFSEVAKTGVLHVTSFATGPESWLIGTDGSRISVHATDQLTFNANGVITVQLTTFNVRCG